MCSLLTSREHEHERAAGAWHAEWQPLSDLLRTVGSAAAWLADCLSSLEVDADRMRTNLQDAGAGLAAEAVAGALTGALGRTAAHDLVSRAVRAPFGVRTALLEETRRCSRCSRRTSWTFCSTRPVTSGTPGR